MARKLKGPLPSQDNPNIRQPEVDSDDEICELPGPGRYTVNMILSVVMTLHCLIIGVFLIMVCSNV